MGALDGGTPLPFFLMHGGCPPASITHAPLPFQCIRTHGPWGRCSRLGREITPRVWLVGPLWFCRKIAYKLLNQKLDVWYNGDAAVVSLKKAKQLQKSRTRHRKARQRHLVKALAKLEAKTDPQLLSSDDAVGVAQSAGAARGSGNADGSAGAAAGAEVHDAAAEAKRKYFEVQQRRKAEREAAKEQRRLRQEAHRRQMQQARADVEVQ